MALCVLARSIPLRGLIAEARRIATLPQDGASDADHFKQINDLTVQAGAHTVKVTVNMGELLSPGH